MKTVLTSCWLFTLILTGCSAVGDQLDSLDLKQPQEISISDGSESDSVAAPETLLDIPRAEVDGATDLTVDSDTDDLVPGCQAGSGCFGDPCIENSQCLSSWCVEHLGEGICSQSCEEECPPGWACKTVDSGPDMVSICVSLYSNLCKPCKDAEGCTSAGTADVCVNYGEAGSFCGGSCDLDEDCPWGFSCLDSETIDGLAVTQCMADAGECPCSGRSIELALWTPCINASDDGICTGKRVCTENGLSDCDAELPEPETCDGIDQDCDGLVDEPDLVEGKFIELCNDGNPCTADSCLGIDGCLSDPLTEGECGDEDSCTIGDHCEDGTCVGLPVNCDDDNPCTDDSCDGLGGCQSLNNSELCDDDDPCTVADHCKNGECNGYTLDCDCLTDTDCSALEDGDACNGTLYCDTEQEPYKCEVNAETVVSCPEPDGSCQAATCDPQSGQCGIVAANEGFACDDGDACTIGDHCQNADCQPGVLANCNDGNTCTDDFCEPQTGCYYENNETTCNDNDSCTSGDKCQAGVCSGTIQLNCDDGNPCTSDSCDTIQGCVHIPSAEACDDGNLCTLNDHCSNGICGPGKLDDCDDGNECTADSCSADTGCLHTSTSTPCSDDDPCTVNDYCNNSVCVSGAQVLCSDGNSCTEDSCGDAGICLFVPVVGDCDDGNKCTDGDHCDAGQCVYDSLAECEDQNICTTDGCDPLGGCIHTLNSAPCDDGDVCTLSDHCHLGECIHNGVMSCKDTNFCTDDSCHPLTGCLFLSNIEPCDDGNACTQGDICTDGSCLSGAPTPCNDNLFCNGIETCDEVTGCVNGTPPTIDDLVECTVDLCDEDTDKVYHAANNEFCSNLLYCDGDEVCDVVLGCLDGVIPEADDDIECTVDSCDETEDQIVHEPDAASCDDQQICTLDTCNPLSGCEHEIIGDCGGPYYKLVGDPNPSMVFNSVVETHYYPNNLVNGIWHKPGNKIIVGHSYSEGYWSYDGGSTNYGDTPNIQNNGSYDRMVHVPSPGLLFASTNGHDSPAHNQIFVADISHDSGAVGSFQAVLFSDGFTGNCNLMSATPDQFLCWDGSVIRKYSTAEGSNVITYIGNLTLSPTPSDVCDGGCFQGTFAWDGKYYYFTKKGSTRYNLEYQVWNANGSYVSSYTATGSGGINGAYFDWSSGRYSTHDGWGDRSGGNIHSSHQGLTTDDSQCYSPVSSAHSL
jgi:hypothetical protein